MTTTPPPRPATQPDPLLLAEAMAALADAPAEGWLVLDAVGDPVLVSAAVPRLLGDTPERLGQRELLSMCAAVAGRWPSGLRVDDQRSVRFVPLSQGGRWS